MVIGGLCDRSIFWLIGGTADIVSDAYNFTVILNCTTFETGNYNTVKVLKEQIN